MEKSIKCTVKGSRQRKGTSGLLAVAPLELSFRTIIPYT